MAEQMIQNAIADYEAILEIQKDYWTKVGTHPRGEVLQGLGNAYRALGNKEKANHYFDRIRTELPETPYAKRAATWFEKGDLTLRETQCIGCHTGK
jgi:tetratricopeptide (TPR) repeat protein